MRFITILLAFMSSLFVGGIAAYHVWQHQSFTWDLPKEIPPPPVPEDNPMHPAKVNLGRFLFYDTRLSQNQQISCATCHIQKLAFSEPRTLSQGLHGNLTPRNAMSLTNVAYNPNFTWANPLLTQLEHQMLIPLFGEEPPEMGMAGQEKELVERLQQVPIYQSYFSKAFPNEDNPISINNMIKAISSFQRTLLSFNSPYDQYLQGEHQAISDSAKRGMKLFFSEKTECFHCHGGFNFSDSSVHANSRTVPSEFHNNGLYNLDGKGSYPKDNRGLYTFTLNASDMGKFRAPTLRNIRVTAPYMHDGSIATLEDVLEHYVDGGRTILEGPNKGFGSANPYKSEFVVGLILTDEQKSDLLAFLDSLTDEDFLTNEQFTNPWPLLQEESASH
ncbi:methanobactin export MATE transporter MbnM [Algicola sagamiensis]|uniref:methanobactin export MATE transporter MbnM n=1 Tax=Algicola sagamiensis TaxID=163869 RepID=UPI0003799A3F|nr:methanobactin export MATE transporter MbnM [Algicola sagamiensis]